MDRIIIDSGRPDTFAEAADLKSVTEQQILTETGFYWREQGGIKVLVCRALEHFGFVNGFSTRLGGVSPFPSGDLNLAGFSEDSDENIMENRRRFLGVFDGDPVLTTVWQTHGDGIKSALTAESAAKTDDRFDAIVSDLPRVMAGVKTADCVPILIGDPVTMCLAAVHAGWRGTAASIAAKTVERMNLIFDARPGNLVCAIGPAAGGERYEIGREVIEAFAANFRNSERYFTPTRPGHALVDLKRSNRDQLIEAGVKPENVYIAPFCTMERTDLFFSYRVEKRLYGRVGRLLSVIGKIADTVAN